MKTYNSDATIRRITKYYLSDYKTKLTKHDEHLLFRWRTAYSILANNNGAEQETARMLMKFHGISRTQAYKDVNNCLKCFGPIGGWDRQNVRHMVSQWALECLREATLKNNFKTMDLFLDRLIKANRLDKKDAGQPDPAKIHPQVQPHAINFSFLTTEYFRHINPKAQEALLELHEKVLSLIDASPVAEYKNVLLISSDKDEVFLATD
jgi:hypothetical protein